MSAISYTPGDGGLVICGTKVDGSVYVLDSNTLDEVQSLSVLEGGVTHVAVSMDGLAFATVDTTRATSIFRYMVNPEARVGSRLDDTQASDVEEVKSWVFVGSYRAHYKSVKALTWGEPSTEGGAPRLWTIGDDGFLVEYDVDASSITGGVKLAKREKVLRDALPTACTYAPSYGGAYLREGVLLLSDDGYKFKVQRVPDSEGEPSVCRKTVLGPTFGEPPCYLQVVPGGEYALYATPSKVVGLLRLPPDGNPARCVGMVAHPGEVAACTLGVLDGAGTLGVVTAGGADDSMLVWGLNLEAAAAVEGLGGEGMEPFYNLLAGGSGGSQHEELLDYFYYAQLVAQGEDAVGAREITGRAPFEQTADLLRAVRQRHALQHVACHAPPSSVASRRVRRRRQTLYRVVSAASLNRSCWLNCGCLDRAGGSRGASRPASTLRKPQQRRLSRSSVMRATMRPAVWSPTSPSKASPKPSSTTVP
eukprot:SAG11_NODE_1795_length_4248_cov_6.202699_2_plen_477_part_00